MKDRLFTFGVLILALSGQGILNGQDVTGEYRRILEKADQRYGPSGELLNGEKYFYPYHQVQGDPFLNAGGSPDGSIQMDGTLYEDQKIRYDIYSQMVVLDYTAASGAPGSVVLRDEWVDFFTIGGKLFRKFPDPDGREQFAQVIFEGEVSCIFFWSKSISRNIYDSSEQSFSDPDRTMVLLKETGPCTFKGRSSLLRCFGKEWRSSLKKLLKEQHIRVRKAGDWQMRNLMQEINQLIDS